MNAYQEFLKCQKEILELIDELNGCEENLKLANKYIGYIKANIELIKNLDVNSLSEKEMDEVAFFVETISDALKEFEDTNTNIEEPAV